MKILIAIKNLSNAAGGGERVACKVASSLACKGHEITLLTFDPLYSKSFYPLDSRIKKINLDIGNSSANSTIVDFVQRIYSLRKNILKIRPQIVIGFMHSMYIPLSLGLIGIDIPVIASEHTVINYYKNKPIEFSLLLFASLFIKKFTVISQLIKDKYPFSIRKKMVIISNPIKTPDFKRFTKKISERKIILNIGRLDHSKDHQTLIEAFSLIADNYPDWDMHIFGDGVLKNKIKNKIKTLDLSNRIFLKGITKDIASIYMQSDVFVTSSRFEAFGLATAEAMSYKLPCVGFSDCSGTNELIKNEKTGLLIHDHEDRARGLAKGISRICSNENLREILGSQGHNFIITNYSEKKIIEFWEKLLYDIVN